MHMPVKLFASTAVSLAVAGTCLAVPAFAAGDSSSLGSALGVVAQAAEQGRASDASAAAADEAVSLATHTIFGGLAFDLPQDYEQQKSSDSGDRRMWSNAAGTGVVAVHDLRDIEIPGKSGRADYFAQAAQASVTGFDGVAVQDLGVNDELGFEIYGYAANVSDADGDYVVLQMFIPMEEGGFTYVQVGYMVDGLTDAQVDELGDVIDSLKLADDDGLDIEGLETSSCGLAFELPEGVSAYDGDENCWMDEDGDILIKAVGHVVEAASKLTAEDYAEILDQLTPTGDSADSKVTELGSDVVEGRDVTSMYVSYKVEDPDATMYAAVIIAPAADDSLSLLIVWCSEEGSQRYGTAIAAMMESFRQE